MPAIKNMSIKNKLISITMATCVAALLIAGVVFIGWEWLNLRRAMVQNLSTQAEIIADNCKASVAFKDSKDAAETLRALHVDKSIVFGCIYTPGGKAFTSYYRDFADAKVQPPEIKGTGHYFSNDILTIFKPIVLDDDIIGTVCIRSDLHSMYVMLSRNAGIIIAVILLASLIAYLVSSKLQRIISVPILNLTEVARAVSEKKDYSTRVPKQSNDEVGLLIDSLNDMLEQIQQRDLALVNTNEQLDVKVKERTGELSSANAKLEGEIAERTLAQKQLQQHIGRLNCLYKLSKLIEQPQILLGQIFQETAGLICVAYQHPDKTCAKITFAGVPYKTDNFEKSEISQYAQIKIGGKKVGDIEVYYLGEKTVGKDILLNEEHNLLEAIAERLGHIADRQQTAEKMHLFRSLIDRSNDCIFVIEPQWGHFIDANDKACNSLGYSREELLATTIRDIDKSISDKTAWQQFVKEIETKKDLITQGWYSRKDGTKFFAETSLKLIRHENKDYLIAVTRDITERKQAEEALRRSETKFRALYDTTSDAVMMLADGKFFDCNKAALAIYGCADKEEFCSKHPADLSPPKQPCGTDSLTLANQQITIAMEKGSNHFEWMHKRADTGETFPADVLINAMELDGRRVVHTVVRDITDRKKTEEKQVQLLKEVENTNQELKDFAYVVSHDLKAPLRGIKTLAGWLVSDYSDKLGDEGKTQMNLLLSRVDRMHNLIEGILQYSRIGRAEEHISPVNLNERIPEVIDMISAPKNISITIENELPTIKCEPTRISQIFQNLLSNAVKYMDKPEGVIKVVCVEEDGFWKFSVSDNGPGIEEKYFEKIFKIFQTLAPKDEYESTGIGLTVVKKIVEMYGGRIWVESEIGKGSTFLFTLSKKESEVTNDAKLEANITC
jgi:two-component system sensor kinase FixL